MPSRPFIPAASSGRSSSRSDDAWAHRFRLGPRSTSGGHAKTRRYSATFPRSRRYASFRSVARIIDSDSLANARGYSNGLLFESGRVLFVAGMVGWDKDMALADGLSAQFALALDNVLAVVHEAGGGPSDIGRFTIYVVDKEEYKREAKAIGAVYRERMGAHYPAMALVQVADLLEDGARVEIEATAVLGASS